MIYLRCDVMHYYDKHVRWDGAGGGLDGDEDEATEHRSP